MPTKHGNTGNQHALKEVKKDAVLTIRLRQSSKDKAMKEAQKLGVSVSQYLEDKINV